MRLRHTLILACLFVLPNILWLARGPDFHSIRSDGIGYYAYLPTLLIERDAKFEKFGATLLRNAYSDSDEIPIYTGIKRHPETSNYFDKYLIGVSILLLPFFLIAHLLSHLLGWSADGFGPAYQFAVAGAAATYGAFGIALLRSVLIKYFNNAVVTTTLFAIILGTPFFHYATNDVSFSHVYSFFLFAALLALVDAGRDKSSLSVRQRSVIGIVAALLVLVRPANLAVLLLLPLYGLARRSEFQAVVRSNLRRLLGGGLVVVIFLVIIFPQLALWKYATGHWLIYSYAGEPMEFFSPNIVSTLLSAERGLIVWSPVIFLAIAGLFFVRRHMPDYTLVLPLILIIHTYLVSTWRAWDYGSGFGHRIFTEIGVLFAIPIACLLQTVWSSKFKVPVFALIGTCTIYSTVLMALYWSDRIPQANVTWKHFGQQLLFQSFGQLTLKISGGCDTVDNTAEAACELTVSAQDSEGKPIIHKAFTLLHNSPELPRWRKQAELVTDENGNSKIHVDASGIQRYRAEMDLEGFILSSRVIQLTSGVSKGKKRRLKRESPETSALH